jgi:hypothetical protein
MSIDKGRADTIFDTLRLPLATLLGQKHGIGLKKNGDWYNLSYCPWCGHGAETHDNFQCGVSERPAERGYFHAVRCQHPHHSAAGEPAPHYADFLVALGELTQEEANWAKSARSATLPRPAPPPRTRIEAPRPEGGLGLMNEENNARARRRLLANPKALKYLQHTRGFSMDTIARFKMGLSEPYSKDGKVIHADALAAPLVGVDGRFYKKYVNYAVPGVTTDKRDKPQKAWSPGESRAYYAGDSRDKQWLFVCDGLKDLWALHQLLNGTELEPMVALVSSTNGGGGLPAEWKDEAYWERWKRVYAGHDNDRPDELTGKRAGDEHAKALSRHACREILRVAPTATKDWNDWVLAGHTAAEFKQLLIDAEPIKVVEAVGEDEPGHGLGRFSANPVSIVGAFHNGYLYEAVRTLVRDLDPESGDIVEFYDTVVIRSDRTAHRVKRMPSPKGVSDQNTVWRLYPDGTLLSKLPQPNPNLTWEWPAIKSWLDRKERLPSLQTMLRAIRGHLKASTWLPYEDDYTLLACTVAASYVQQVFDAVPLILVTGAAGTGKSELGMALKSMGANSRNVLGQVSSATIARFIDSTRGMVVLDDLEEIANSKDSTFGDLVQTLKLSYKKATAMKMVTELRANGQAIQREFNFFGIKVINNTRGSDAILGTRMLTIQTRRMPAAVMLDSGTRLLPDELDALRNSLHTWAFKDVTSVAEAYQAIFPNKSSRQEEIAAPLRVVAALSGDEQLTASLEAALARQSKQKANPDGPEDILKEALEGILRRSVEQSGAIQTWVTVTQVMMEMALLVDINYGKEFTTSLSSIEKPEWVGRALRQNYADINAEQQRTNMYGKGLRAYKLSSDFVTALVAKISADAPALTARPLASIDDFKAFCAGCPTCPYRNRCEMQSVREAREAVPGRVS